MTERMVVDEDASRSRLSLREQRKGKIAKSARDGRTEIVNDMLQVVNSHLASTLTDLRYATRDFETLADISPVAAIFVDSGMRIRRFTPWVASNFKLRVSDLGRALTSVRCNLPYDELADDFERLKQTGELIERHLPSTEDADFLVSLIPHSSPDGTMDGAAITFTRIDRFVC